MKKDKRRDEKIAVIKKSIQEKEEDLRGFQDKLKQLPDKVSILEVLEGRPMNRCDLEKKRLYDLMQCLAYNSRERLVELFRECYDDKRDVKQVLDMIVGKGGLMRLFGETLVVVIDRISNAKHREAAQKFFRLINARGIRRAGRLNLKLFFNMTTSQL